MIYKTKRLTTSGIELIKKLEKFMPQIYQDQAGKDTIGYGHLIRPGEHYDENTYLTPAQAEELLTHDVKSVESTINHLVQVPLTQNQFNALVSFVYNVGQTAFKNSTLLRRLNDYDYDGVIYEFSRWNKITVDGKKIVDNILVNRRKHEQELFMS